VFYQDCQKNDDELIFVFSPAVIHLQVEYIGNVVHAAQSSQENINCEVGVMTPLLHINEGKDLPSVIDDS